MNFYGNFLIFLLNYGYFVFDYFQVKQTNKTKQSEYNKFTYPLKIDPTSMNREKYKKNIDKIVDYVILETEKSTKTLFFALDSNSWLKVRRWGWKEGEEKGD